MPSAIDALAKLKFLFLPRVTFSLQQKITGVTFNSSGHARVVMNQLVLVRASKKLALIFIS